MIYRARTNLDAGKKGIIPKGGVFCSGFLSPEIIEILEKRGRILPIAAPPLEELPGWRLRSAKMARAGVVMADAFLEADANELARSIKVKASLIEAWKQEVIGLLSIPEPKG